MKIKYERPMAIFDEFASNQFIAACGEKYNVTNGEMNCVNRNHYPEGVNPSHTENNGLHRGNGSARVYNVFTNTLHCGTVIGTAQPFSENPAPIHGPVYVFNNKSGSPMQYDEAKDHDLCFGAYIRQGTSGTTTNPFSA
ncbi:hypothetical protein [Intestinibacter bartlettii]|uniref:Uncharacterized protein n=1 Tax=Intestinibacter bartlettii TaxID=261299 RepID=A0ABS6DZK8_9FIRM|nr:hypothetical protein [Intestinibacter bartlettii]MBU5337273.1 hypothetical protein [Intestinibacter bartlettii]